MDWDIDIEYKNVREKIVNALNENREWLDSMSPGSIHRENCQGWVEALGFVLGLIDAQEAE
tara:strand:- start:202 stop:384 length:183 start_codon:yes stop_codon:yes gene_type:complete